MLLFDTRADLFSLSAFHARVGALLELDESNLQAQRPEISGWSPLQQLFHVLLANELAYRNVRLVLEGTSPWLRRGEGPNLLGFLLLQAGRMPRGVARAPRIVTPPKRPNLAIVKDTLASNEDARAQIAASLAAVLAAGLADGGTGIPHQDLGNLGPAPWIAFAALHGRHHLAIAEELLAARA